MEVVESPFVRVPFEALKKAAKERKYIVEEVDKVMKKLDKHAGTSQGKAPHKSSSSTDSHADRRHHTQRSS